MAESVAIKELKQIRAILGKILKATEAKPIESWADKRDKWIAEFARDRQPPRQPQLSIARNVSSRCDAILYHLGVGNTIIARELVLMLAREEGEPRK